MRREGCWVRMALEEGRGGGGGEGTIRTSSSSKVLGAASEGPPLSRHHLKGPPNSQQLPTPSARTATARTAPRTSQWTSSPTGARPTSRSPKTSSPTKRPATSLDDMPNIGGGYLLSPLVTPHLPRRVQLRARRQELESHLPSRCPCSSTTWIRSVTTRITGESLTAPYRSTVTPSATYLADPLNAYAHLGEYSSCFLSSLLSSIKFIFEKRNCCSPFPFRPAFIHDHSILFLSLCAIIYHPFFRPFTP